MTSALYKGDKSGVDETRSMVYVNYLEGSCYAGMILDEDARVGYLNRGWADLSGYPAEELIGRDFVEMVCEKEEAKQLLSKLSERTLYSFRVRSKHADGGDLRIGGFVLPLAAGYCVVARELMDEKESVSADTDFCQEWGGLMEVERVST
jgi:PAS domain S-box-containing protein